MPRTSSRNCVSSLLLNACGFLRRHLSESILVLLLCAMSAHAAEVHRLASPDGRIQVALEMPAPGSNAQPRWSATFRGKPFAANCRLGLQTAQAGDVMAGVTVVRERNRSVN